MHHSSISCLYLCYHWYYVRTFVRLNSRCRVFYFFDIRSKHGLNIVVTHVSRHAVHEHAFQFYVVHTCPCVVRCSIEYIDGAQ